MTSQNTTIHTDPHGFNNVVRLGLERITALLEKLDRPDRKLRFIHVAGTNGKGSVCAFIEAALVADGKCVGKFTSPNLVRVNERICVNKAEISDTDLRNVLDTVGSAAEKIASETGESPTQFEIWCAAAMLHFAQKKCDIVLLEVGLGGEYDATNVIEKCEIAVICHIDIDHTAYLGNTIEDIARAKCGIIKENITSGKVITCEQYPEAAKIISETTISRGHKLTVAKAPAPIAHDSIHEIVCLEGIDDIRLSLGGEYQIKNAALAAATLTALGIGKDKIKAGLESAVHHARFEEIADGVIFDGGHNPDGVRSLDASLVRYYPKAPMNVIYACMKDKDIESTLSILNKSDRNFIFTTVQNNPRAMSADNLFKYAKEKCGITGTAAQTLHDAIALARKNGHLTVICGSLYLYGDLYQ